MHVLPKITESINKSFATIAENKCWVSKNKRFAHFCTYSYIITKRVPKKYVIEFGILV